MNRSRFLMSPPDYFDFAYEVNPWKKVRRKVDPKLARKQWVGLYDLLAKGLGVRVEILPPVKTLPNLVFTAHAGLVRRRTFIESRFRLRGRQEEERYYENWFKKKGYKIKVLPRPFYFEGQKNAFFMGKDFYTGLYVRSDLEAYDMIAEHLEISFFGLEINDKRFRHLDMCFMPLNEESALTYLPALEPYGRMLLLENVKDLIETPEAEALNFACQAIAVDRHIMIPQECRHTARELKKRKFRVHELDFSEFLKVGAGPKSLALRLE